MLLALTPEAHAALGARDVTITRFPYRVGRDSRGMQPTSHGVVIERRGAEPQPANDLYLLDRAEPLNVSREHFTIDRDGTGYILVDHASTCGTIVEGRTVGGHARGGSIPLHDGDVIIVGTSLSRYVFKFRAG